MNSVGFTVFLHVMMAGIFVATYYFMKNTIGLNRIWSNFVKIMFFSFYMVISPLLLPDSWIYVNATAKDALTPQYRAYWVVSQTIFAVFFLLGLLYLTIQLLWRTAKRFPT